jgi:hypothetical protein
MSEFGALRDDARVIVMNEAMADHLAERMARRFHAAQHKAKGGRADGLPGANPAAANQWGGKSIIKYNPTSDETQRGIRQEVSLLVWQSPDGLPHPVTIDVGRIAAGLGGPGSDDGPGSAAVGTGIGGGTYPLGSDATDSLSYRASAQVLLGTPGTMQDPFFIDVNRGQRFTTCASYCAITAAMDAPPTGLDPNLVGTFASGSMAVYATLTANFAESEAPLQFTQFIEITNDPGSPITGQFAIASRIIPPRANLLLPFSIGGQPAVNTEFFIEVFDNSGFVLTTVKNGGTQTQSPAIPLAQDAYSVRLTASNLMNMTGLYTARFIYQLSV